MKLHFVLLLFFIIPAAVVQGKNTTAMFDKPEFYAAMSSGKLAEIENELAVVTASGISEKEGYEGALLMRKAGLLKIPAQKLKYFKRGRIKLETALLNDNDNAEYHFLRLAIQEHAPKIVKYNAQIETDKAFVIKSFKNLPPAVQQAITDYSKNSKILHPQDL